MGGTFKVDTLDANSYSRLYAFTHVTTIEREVGTSIIMRYGSFSAKYTYLTFHPEVCNHTAGSQCDYYLYQLSRKVVEM